MLDQIDGNAHSAGSGPGWCLICIWNVAGRHRSLLEGRAPPALNISIDVDGTSVAGTTGDVNKASRGGKQLSRIVGAPTLYGVVRFDTAVVKASGGEGQETSGWYSTLSLCVESPAVNTFVDVYATTVFGTQRKELELHRSCCTADLSIGVPPPAVSHSSRVDGAVVESPRSDVNVQTCWWRTLLPIVGTPAVNLSAGIDGAAVLRSG